MDGEYDIIRTEHRFTALESAVEHIEKARGIQAAEYERRLDDLNGERQREREHMADFLPRETFDQFTGNFTAKEREDAKWRDSVNAALATSSGKGAGIGLAWGVGLAALGVIVTVVNFLR